MRLVDTRPERLGTLNQGPESSPELRIVQLVEIAETVSRITHGQGGNVQIDLEDTIGDRILAFVFRIPQNVPTIRWLVEILCVVGKAVRPRGDGDGVNLPFVFHIGFVDVEQVRIVRNRLPVYRDNQLVGDEPVASIVQNMVHQCHHIGFAPSQQSECLIVAVNVVNLEPDRLAVLLRHPLFEITNLGFG